MDFDAALEAGAKACYYDMRKKRLPKFFQDKEWDDLDSIMKFSIKESVLPIVNAVILSVGSQET